MVLNSIIFKGICPNSQILKEYYVTSLRPIPVLRSSFSVLKNPLFKLMNVFLIFIFQFFSLLFRMMDLYSV